MQTSDINDIKHLSTLLKYGNKWVLMGDWIPMLKRARDDESDVACL